MTRLKDNIDIVKCGTAALLNTFLFAYCLVKGIEGAEIANV